MVEERDLGGRPEIEINLAELQKLTKLHCTNPEIAAYFGVSLSTVERRIAGDVQFREIIEQGRASLKVSVRRKQFELLEAGNPTMAIWMGKQYCGQKDQVESSGTMTVLDQYQKMLDERRTARDAERAAEEDATLA